MELTIECECGNKVRLQVAKGKDLQLRDGLEAAGFSYEDAEIKEGKLCEIRIRCVKCQNWVVMSVD